MKAATKFWNNNKIVKEFKNADAQSYWVEYFAKIENKEKVTVLDLGCGGGRYTEMLAKMGFTVFSFDLHRGMVQQTKERIRLLKNLKTKPIILQAEMTNMPFENEKFDIILSNGVFHNADRLSNLEKGLTETARTLKASGILCLNMFYDGGNNTLLKKNKGKYAYTTKDGLPMVLLPLENLITLMSKYGLEKFGKTVVYTRDMEVGTRDVVRGVFKKI